MDNARKTSAAVLEEFSYITVTKFVVKIAWCNTWVSLYMCNSLISLPDLQGKQSCRNRVLQL